MSNLTDEELLELVREAEHNPDACDELCQSRNRVYNLGTMALKGRERVEELEEAIDGALYQIIHADDVDGAIKTLTPLLSEWRAKSVSTEGEKREGWSDGRTEK